MPPTDPPPPLSLAAYPTRASARAALADQGVTGAAAEALLSSTSHARHAHRIRRYREGALGEYARVTGQSAQAVAESCTPDAALHGIAAILLDAVGIGSVDPGHAHQHHRAFTHDCGPRFGGPSGAYASAAHAALLWLWAVAFGSVPAMPSIGLWPAEDGGPPGLLIVFDDGTDDGEEPGELTLRVDPEPIGEGVDAPPPLWLLAVAHEGARRAAGLPPGLVIGEERDAHLRATSPAPLDTVRRFGGTLAAWSTLVNAIERRRRVEEVASRIAKVARDWTAAHPGAELPRMAEFGPRRIGVADVHAWIDRVPLGAAREAVKRAIADDVEPLTIEAMVRAALAAGAGGA